MAPVGIVGIALRGSALLSVAGAGLWAWTNHGRFNSWRRTETGSSNAGWARWWLGLSGESQASSGRCSSRLPDTSLTQ